MRISTAQLFQQGVAAMLDQQRELSRTELQVASGQRILRPSDDPASAVRVLDLGEAQQRLAQYQRNADMAVARLEQEETALVGIGDLLQRVRELAVQGASDTLGSEGRQAIAAEVRQHLDSFMQLANTRDANGEYLFAGFQSLTQPFSLNAQGELDYAGDAGQRFVQIGDSREVAVGDPGGIFMDLAAADGGTTDLGAVLNDLAAALEAGNGRPQALSDIDTALGAVLNTRAKIGARLNAVEDQKNANDAFDLAVTEVRSSLEDLDYAEAVSRFNQQLTALQAAQQSFIRVQDLSLFNFLR